MADTQAKLPSQLSTAGTLSNDDLLIIQQGEGIEPVKRLALSVLKSWLGTGGDGVASWNDLEDKPTTLSGFGITDAVSTSALATALGNYLTTAAASDAFQAKHANLSAISALSVASFGLGLLTKASATEARSALELGSAALSAASAFATAAQGALADSAVQPSALTSALAAYQPLNAGLTAISALSTTSFGRSLLTQADAAAARTALGLGNGATLAINVANGLATLDSGGKIATTYLPDVILGQVRYLGTWDAATNSPSLPSASSAKGAYYIVSVAGTYNSVPFDVGDWAISDGSSWDKVDNTDAISSYNGRTGAIVPVMGDYAAFYQPLATSLTAFGSLANSAGWLYNNGAGMLSYSAPTAAAVGAEPALGNPPTGGYVLSSTASGVRSWVAAASGSGTVTSITAGTGLSGGTITTSGVLAVSGALASLYSLSNSAGWLYNDGTGIFSYSSPTKSTVGLGSVENTALSTWAGSTNLTTLGTVASGVWSGTAIASGYIAAALTGKTYNGLNLTAAGTGFAISGGTAAKTLTVSGDSEVNQPVSTTSSPSFVSVAVTNNLSVSGTINGLTCYNGTSAFTLSGASSYNYTLGIYGNVSLNQHLLSTSSPTFAGLTVSGLATGVVTNTSGVLSSTGSLAAALGGTGLASYTAGDLLYASSSTALAKFSPGSTAGNLRWSGSAWALDTASYLSSTALKAWTGSSNVVTLGTISTGVWHGTAIADGYIASASTWGSKQTAYANLSTIGALGNSAGYLYNNGSGSFSYSAPTASMVGLGAVENTALSTWAGSAYITTLGIIAAGLTTAGICRATGLTAYETSIPEAASTYGSARLYMCTSAGVNSGQYIRLHWNGNSNKLYVSANGSTTLYVMN